MFSNVFTSKSAGGSGYNPASVAITGGTITGVTSVSSDLFRFPSSTQITAPSDGTLLMTDTAGTAFTLLYFGGTGGTFPALRRAATALECVNATGGSYADFKSAGISITPTTAVPAGGNANVRLALSSSNIAVLVGSGVPTVSAAQGSLYLRSDGSSTSTRAYINNSAGSGTTWTAITTAA